MEYDADLNYAYSVNRIAELFDIDLDIDPSLISYISKNVVTTCTPLTLDEFWRFCESA